MLVEVISVSRKNSFVYIKEDDNWVDYDGLLIMLKNDRIVMGKIITKENHYYILLSHLKLFDQFFLSVKIS